MLNKELLADKLRKISEESITLKADKIISVLTAEAEKNAKMSLNSAKIYDWNLKNTDVLVVVKEYFIDEGFEVLTGNDNVNSHKDLSSEKNITLEPQFFIQISW